MSVIPVPTLSDRGWVRSAQEKLDFVIAHFFEAENNQSYIYHGNVVSLQSLIHDSGQDMLGLAISIRTQLERILNRYFEAALAEVSTVDYNGDSSGGVTFRVYAKVVQEGKEYSVGQLFRLLNSRFSQVTQLNNNGVV